MEYFSEEIKGMVTSPASNELHIVRHDANSLEGSKKDEFYPVMQKLLNVCKRACSDIDTVAAYLCTRITKSTNHDW